MEKGEVSCTPTVFQSRCPAPSGMDLFMTDPRKTSKLLGALLLSVGTLHATPSLAAPAASPIPVPNGNFELAGGSSGLPAFWTAKGICGPP